MKQKNKHIGNSFDDFLAEEGLSEEVQELAIKKIKQLIAFELEKAMKKSKLNKTQMAQLMKTSRVQIVRLLDPNNSSVTLSTLCKAALATGKNCESLLNLPDNSTSSS